MTNDEGAVLIYVTAPTREVALDLARTVVRERLAACANVLGEISSVYWWDGEVQESGETAMVLKTMASKADRLIERVADLHPYDCPCVIRWPIEGGHPPFLAWIAAETDTVSA